jgi:hypothetical protein
MPRVSPITLYCIVALWRKRLRLSTLCSCVRDLIAWQVRLQDKAKSQAGTLAYMRDYLKELQRYRCVRRLLLRVVYFSMKCKTITLVKIQRSEYQKAQILCTTLLHCH